MQNEIKLRITTTIQHELREVLDEAIRNREVSANINSKTDITYLKIHSALEKSKGVKTVTVTFSESDVDELKSRIENEIGRSGICTENISTISDFTERAYWMGRRRAYQGLLDQIRRHELGI